MGSSLWRITIIGVLWIFLAFAILNSPVFVSATAEPITIRVPEDYKRIQWAINNASEVWPTTIQVAAGTYHENLVINKPITLIGENKSTTIIDGRLGTVVLIGVDNVNLKGFTIRNALGGNGIHVKPSSWDASPSNITISGNIFWRNRIDICIEDSEKVTMSNNLFGGNNIFAIFTENSHYNIITNNLIKNNIQLHTSSYNELLNNIIIDGHIGILYGQKFAGRGENTLINNTILNGRTLLIDQCSNNLIYHNNFINNSNPWISDGKQALVQGNYSNLWDTDYPSGGNFWSDYTGTDNDGDGIGDSPYIIDERNIDRYPLMRPFEIDSRWINFSMDLITPIANAGQDSETWEVQSVTLDGSKSIDNVGIVNYEWDFGDGTKGSGMTVTHKYNRPGTYVVKLTVRDAVGYVDTDYVTVEVKAFWWIVETALLIVIAITATYIVVKRKIGVKLSRIHAKLVKRVLILCTIWLLISGYLYFNAFQTVYYDRSESRYHFQTPRLNVNIWDVVVWEVKFITGQGIEVEIVEQFERPSGPNSFDVQSKHSYYDTSPARGEFVAQESGKYWLEIYYPPAQDVHVKIICQPAYLKILFFSSVVLGPLGIVVFLRRTSKVGGVKSAPSNYLNILARGCSSVFGRIPIRRP